MHRGLPCNGRDVAGGGTEQTIDADEHRTGGAAHLVSWPRCQAIQNPPAQLTGDERSIDRPAGCRERGDPHDDRRPSTHAISVAPPTDQFLPQDGLDGGAGAA